MTTYATRPGPATDAVRRLAGPAATAVSVGAATLVLALVDPNQPSHHYPLCPLKFLTGLDCPACGGLRCVHSLATGHPIQALDHNALAVILFPAVIFQWMVWTRRRWRADYRRVLVPPRLLYTIYGIAVVFAVVRNLPFVPFLRSGIG